MVYAGLLAVVGAAATRAGASTPARNHSNSPGSTSGLAAVGATSSEVSSRSVVMPSGMREVLAEAHRKVPAFSRQTGLPCSACHYQFPQLTPFGRLFKLNGYTLVGLKPIAEPNAKKGAPLSLLPIPPLAVALMASANHLNEARPGAQNDAGEFPQQLSLFLAGALSTHFGALLQATYVPVSGTFGIDNSDVRYVTRARVASHDMIFGVTLNNNPSVQDVWNTTPAWGYPFIASDITPATIATEVINGPLAQQSVGLGAYGLWNNLLYLELSGYRTALQPGASPADSTATNAISGLTPYWRGVLEHQFGATYGMIGTYGLVSHLYPTGVTGMIDSYTDAALDAQVEHPFGGGGVVIGRATWINEHQVLGALFAAKAADQLDHVLNTVEFNVNVQPSALYGITAGYFSTTGTRDTLLYAPASLVGSRSGKPVTNGFIEEFDFNPWQNIRIGLQGVQFSLFNGAAANYDGSGRPATGNNTIYLFTWVAF